MLIFRGLADSIRVNYLAIGAAVAFILIISAAVYFFIKQRQLKKLIQNELNLEDKEISGPDVEVPHQKGKGYQKQQDSIED
mmetsp:Transcript_1741/g.1669  ORF Transcript_1741/g.1669 Transcript_1741/m.1669 type:complete len:81 (+) Transcript_1741:307-549(+)